MPGQSIHKINMRINQVLHWMWLSREGGCKMGGHGSDTLGPPLAWVPKAAPIHHYYIPHVLGATSSGKCTGPELLLRHELLCTAYGRLLTAPENL